MKDYGCGLVMADGSFCESFEGTLNLCSRCHEAFLARVEELENAQCKPLYRKANMNNWHNGNSIGTMYILDEDDLSRVGDSWMNGRLRAGDVVLCTAHSGDRFNQYVLIRPFQNGMEAILGSSFGAYVFGTKLE